MFDDINKVTLVGKLGADPEVKSFQNGGRICNLRVATSKSWKDKQSGERKERTEWHSVSVQSDGLVGLCERFLRKGTKVYVEGELRTRKWQDAGGNDRYSTEVVVSGYGNTVTKLDKSESGGGSSGGSGGGGGGTQRGSDRSGRYGQSFGDEGSAGGGGGSDWGSSGSSKGSFADDLDDDIPFITSDWGHEWRAR